MRGRTQFARLEQFASRICVKWQLKNGNTQMHGTNNLQNNKTTNLDRLNLKLCENSVDSFVFAKRWRVNVECPKLQRETMVRNRTKLE